MPPQLHRLAAVLTGVAEAHRDQQALDGRSHVGGDGELDEGVPVQRRRRRQRRDAGSLLQEQQRAHRVDGHALRVGLAEHIVEDLERERSGVPGREDVPDERREVEPALAGEAAVVPAPLQDVHDQVRRVGELEVEDLLAGDLADPRRVGSPREDVEGVQAGAEGRVVGAP